MKTMRGKFYSLFVIAALASIVLLLWFNNWQIGNLKINTNKSYISTVIVPHHDLMKSERGNLLKNISHQISPKTVILVSPNHFNTGRSDFITTDKVWQLGDSQVEPDKPKIQALTNLGFISNEDAAFIGEHGIANLLDQISSNFPKAKIVPLIIKQTADYNKIDSIAQAIFSSCRNDCLLISSVDFSHYQPGALAEIHDQLSIKALNNLDEDLVKQTEVDSNQSLLLAVKWAKLNQTEKFNLYQNTNSAKLAGERDTESTSYVLGYFGQGKIAQIDNEISFTLAGDTMLGRGVANNFSGNKLTSVVQNLGNRVFWGTDVSLVNLEGPIAKTEPPPINDPNDLTFNMPPETTKVLNFLHVNAVGLGNNHSENQGQAGLADTKNLLSSSGIVSIGSQSQVDDSSIHVFASGTKKIALIAVNATGQEPDILSMIKKAKAAGDYVIIFPHWGNEYQTVHSSSQQALAYKWVEAGADAIFGSHPHVIEDAELYHGKPVFYSLGNFIFDQNISPETQVGLIISGLIKDNQLKIVILPVVSKNLQPYLAAGDQKTTIIKKLRSDLNLAKIDTGYGYDTINLTIN